MSESVPEIMVTRETRVYSVSDLNREVRALLEVSFPLIRVEGEISNLARPSSGHLYFSLKDPVAQVRCAMFRTRNRLLSFAPTDGMRVLVRARVSLYEPRGDFQLIVEHMEESGEGALRRAFEDLKRRLAAAGLFAATHKQRLPIQPRCIGVLTSPTGAAIRDILSVLRRRCPAIPVLVYPIAVQGTGAAEQIVRTLQVAMRRNDCDVLILARGGGSLEDLWAFNEERVAQAIFDCPIPVVTGIGHEIDVTIADFVADQRGATPSAAAELVSPNREEWLARLVGLESRLRTLIEREIRQKRQALLWLERRLEHPGRRLSQQVQRVDELEQRLRHAQRVLFRHTKAQLAELTAHLYRLTPLHRLKALEERQAHLAHRLRVAGLQAVDRRRQRLALLSRALDAVSPLATLSRGYAIVRRLPEQQVLSSSAEVKPGEHVEARLAHGCLVCTVDATEEC